MSRANCHDFRKTTLEENPKRYLEENPKRYNPSGKIARCCKERGSRKER